ncbi:MAG: AAA family ATPase [Prevotella sp.]|nr:AAA family ATPase [Prevotella sp.]
MENTRKYPVGIQTFSEIIGDRYVYVDKTDLVWQLAHYAKYIFLSRPRRFGKSLLSSTLNSYFSGERELFEGLKIMNLEQEWAQYPVIHLDLSTAKGCRSVSALEDRLKFIIRNYRNRYSVSNELTPGSQLASIIERANIEAQRQVVVIIDEYDAPLLDVLHQDESLAEFRAVMQEFYQVLKPAEPQIKFCFITGITKFSQLSIFSTINNLTNVTMDVRFGNICGITEQELVTTLKEDIGLLAESYEMTWDEMHQKLKQKYDGYRFTEVPIEIYNPFSLIKAFQQGKVGNFWFESGTPTFLIRQMKHFGTDIMSLDSMEVSADAFDKPTEAMEDALPLLYQSGYLTIKDYDRETEAYTLGIPNGEVRIGYTQGLLPAYIGLRSSDVQMGFAMKFWRALKKGDIDQAMRDMQAYLAGIPYVEGFKEKLKDVANKEGFYEYTMYLIFSMLNVYARTQVKCAGGRVDMVVWMSDAIYVFELKVNDTAENALKQIDDKSYAIPYTTDGRRVVKVGVSMNADTRMVENWRISVYPK